MKVSFPWIIYFTVPFLRKRKYPCTSIPYTVLGTRNISFTLYGPESLTGISIWYVDSIPDSPLLGPSLVKIFLDLHLPTLYSFLKYWTLCTGVTFSNLRGPTYLSIQPTKFLSFFPFLSDFSSFSSPFPWTPGHTTTSTLREFTM